MTTKIVQIATEEASIDLSDAEGENQMKTEEQSAEIESAAETKIVVKKKKHGILYISSIPKFMTVSILRELLGEYARVGRIFLQPAKTENQKGKPFKIVQVIHLNDFVITDDSGGDKKKKKRKMRYQIFTEGWVEILSKKSAKLIALRLNAKPISTRKKSKFCDILWNIKYLPRFKWIHLSERLTYEKMVHKQRLQNEISQARKEANYFGSNLDKSERNKRKAKKDKEREAAEKEGSDE